MWMAHRDYLFPIRVSTSGWLERAAIIKEREEPFMSWGGHSTNDRENAKHLEGNYDKREKVTQKEGNRAKLITLDLAVAGT